MLRWTKGLRAIESYVRLGTKVIPHAAVNADLKSEIVEKVHERKLIYKKSSPPNAAVNLLYQHIVSNPEKYTDTGRFFVNVSCDFFPNGILFKKFLSMI